MAKTRLTIQSANRRIPFKYCSIDRDRHGNERIYVRVPGIPKYRMKSACYDEQGSITEAFTAEYHRVMAGDRGRNNEPQILRIEPGSVLWLVQTYYRSKTFQSHSPATKKDKKSVLDRYCSNVGELPFKKIRKSDIEASQMKRLGTPGAADKLVKYLKALFNWAISAELATFNPATGVGKIHRSTGFHTWSEGEVIRFRKAYPLGSTARLAMELMLNLGVRRSDLVELGWKNLNGNRIEFSPKKGAALYKRSLSLPIADELGEALEAVTHEEPTFLVTDYGKPFSSNGFGNKMRQWCNDADLPECSSHGLRKTSATILAEAGATEHQLMAIFGWSDSKMAQHYTKAAQSKLIIDAGFERRKCHVARRNVPLSQSQNSGESKRGKNNGKSMSKEGNGGPGGTRTPNQAVMSRRL
jgi:integrase